MKDGLAWNCLQRRNKSQRTAKQIPPRLWVRALHRHLDQQILHRWQEDLTFELPILAYYGVSRVVLYVPMHRKGFSKNEIRFDSLADSLKVNNPYGEVLSSTVTDTSNIRLNKEALASIRRAAPFPPFPDEIAKIRETWEMTVTISFNLR